MCPGSPCPHRSDHMSQAQQQAACFRKQINTHIRARTHTHTHRPHALSGAKTLPNSMTGIVGHSWHAHWMGQKQCYYGIN